MKKLAVSLCTVLFASSLFVSASAANVSTQTPSCTSTQKAPSSCVTSCNLGVKSALSPNNICLTLPSICTLNLQKACDLLKACNNTQTFDLTKNCAQTKACDATKACTPTKPTTPVKPTVPTKPTTPTTPTKPTTPTAPTKPTTPTTPTKPTTPTTPTKPTTPDNSASLSAFEQEVVRLVNEARAENGLKPLTANTDLSNVARTKSQDMKDKNYFSHTSPTYGSPFDMMKSFGISYKTAGENIAYGQKTPAEVMNAWMNSSGHRANILNASFTQIGVGYVSSGNYWTQMFIG